MTCNSIDLFKVHFEKEENEFFQLYSPQKYFSVEIIEKMSQETEELFHEKVLNIAQRWCEEPINLSQWPLFEFSIYSSTETKWYLMVIAPHILGDGFSYNLLIDSITFSYHSLSNASFFKGSFLQQSAAFDKRNDLEFFQKELEGMDSLEVKAIRQERNDQGVIVGTTHQFTISKQMIDPCKRIFHSSEGAIFLALHALLLKKLTDENRIVIGVPVPNRNRSEKSIFGYFVNTLPLVLDFEKIDSLKTLLETINKKILRLLRHQSFDLNHLNKINPHFNNYFTFYDRELNYHLDHCVFERIYLNRSALFSEFTFTVEKRKEDYMFCIETSSYFKSLNMKCLVTNILEFFPQKQHLKEISLGDDPFYLQKLSSYALYHGTESIPDAFEEIASLYPNCIAINDFQWEMSYSELDQLSNQIARFLLQKSPLAKQVILSVPRNCHLIALILAVLKAGKCYVPIDPFCPRERFQFILHQQPLALVIADTETQNRHQLFSDRFISMDQLLLEAPTFSKSSLSLPIKKDALAYMIYTSGTTGHPKGVQISHGNLLSLLHAAKEKFSFRNSDVWTLFHSYAFDFSVWEIFGCLLSGAKLLVLETKITKHPDQFYSILSDYNVTILNQTPTAFRELIHLDLLEQKPLKIHTIIFGGEALCFQNLKDWVKRHPLASTKLINMYGITETTIHVSYYEIQSEDLDKKESVIGKPLSNLGLEILNSEHQVLPHGLTGEIAIFGDGVTSGYYKADELTAKKFIIKEGRRFYLSGDLGKINEEGNLVFLGRKDRQVQIRGFRVELDEIEFHILKTGLIRQCAINVTEAEVLRIVAYVIGNDGFLQESTLREKLKNSLPFYMIPSFFFFVESIPLTLNGKVDFVSLRASQCSTQKVKTLDASPTERKLHTMVSELLKKEDFSLEDNFWDIGLNSIDLATIFNNIKTQFTFKGISMAHLFQYTTVKRLADYLDKAL
jgi:amino acid adenylation domain-containing protein